MRERRQDQERGSHSKQARVSLFRGSLEILAPRPVNSVVHWPGRKDFLSWKGVLKSFIKHHKEEGRTKRAEQVELLFASLAELCYDCCSTTVASTGNASVLHCWESK